MKQIDKIRTFYKDHTAGPINPVHSFAVLIPLIVDEGGDVQILFETRAAKLDAQPGEICFPGGAIEEGESPLQCALRETYEEIGVSADDIEIIGQADTLNNAGLSIFAYAGILKGVTVSPAAATGTPAEQMISGLTLSEAEVEDVFTIPLSFFLGNEPEVHYVRMVPDVPADFPYEQIGQTPDYPWRESHYSVLIYDWPDRHLWGMTAKIVERFASFLKDQ